MIDHHEIGRGIGGAVRYAYAGRRDHPTDKKPELLGWRGVGTSNVKETIADFEIGQSANQRLGNVVWHVSLSFNPTDAAQLDSRKMLEIAERYLEKMRMAQTQYLIIRHHDTRNKHLHIIASRVDDAGKTIPDGQNYVRSKDALRELIQEYNLTPPKGLRPELQHPEKLHGTELVRYELRQALRQELAGATQLTELMTALQAKGIEVRYRLDKAGEPVGISFAKEAVACRGSELGRDYSLKGIQKQLLANAERQAGVVVLPAADVVQPAPTERIGAQQAISVTGGQTPQALAQLSPAPEEPAAPDKAQRAGHQAEYQAEHQITGKAAAALPDSTALPSTQRVTVVIADGQPAVTPTNVSPSAVEREETQWREFILTALAKQETAATTILELQQALATEGVTLRPVWQADGQLREMMLTTAAFPERELAGTALAPQYGAEAVSQRLAQRAQQQAAEQQAAEDLLAAYASVREKLASLEQEYVQAERKSDYGRMANLRYGEILEAEKQQELYQAQLEATPTGQVLLREVFAQEKKRADEQRAAEQQAAKNLQLLREQLQVQAAQALSQPFKPDRETWKSWAEYKAQVAGQGFEILEHYSIPTQLRHIASGECFDLAQVRPGGASGLPLQAQVQEELRQQQAAHSQAESILKDLLAARKFTSQPGLTRQLAERGYTVLEEPDKRHWLRHEASGRQFRLAELRPNDQKLGEQVEAAIASRQAEIVKGRIEVHAEGAIGAIERASELQRRLTTAGMRAVVAPAAIAGGPVVLEYRYELKGPQLEEGNRELRQVQASKGIVVREQDQGYSQPLDQCPVRRGEFAQATVVLWDSPTKQATERVAHATELLQEKGAVVREVALEATGAVALVIGYHTHRTDMPALSQMLDVWQAVPTIDIRETAGAWEARGAQSAEERKAFEKPFSPSRELNTLPLAKDYEREM